MIEEHQLCLLLQWKQEVLEERVVKPRATMQIEDDRSIAHRRTVGDQTHARNVEVETDVTDLDAHHVILTLLEPETFL